MKRLLPYQEEGARYLASRKHALLADEPGLGKTAQTITACDMVSAKSILVCCPACARANWGREFGMWSIFSRDIKVILSEKEINSGHIAGVAVVSYDLLVNAKATEKLKQTPWDVLVLDEAHYLKDRKSKRTKAVYTQIARNAERVWRLTGTPAPNDVGELWTHLHYAGIYTQPYSCFVSEFCSGFDTGFGLKITGTKNIPELKRMLGSFVLRRKKEEVMAQLPDIFYQQHLVKPSPVDEELFFADRFLAGETKEDLHKELSEKNRILKSLWDTSSQMEANKGPAAGARISVLQGLSVPMGTLRRYVGLTKVPEIARMLGEELASRAIQKVVIFCVHRDVIMLTRELMKKYGVRTYFGGMEPHKKQKAIDDFQNLPNIRVFIGQIKAAGTAITLTSANEVVFIEQSWVPADNAQATMRCHRIGQKKPVRVRAFSVENSIDQHITKALMKKTQELTKVFV